MGTKYATIPVHFEVASVKKNAATRVAVGTKVAAQGPSSALYQLTDVKSAVDGVVTETAAVKAAVDDYNKAHGVFLKTRTALALVVGAWDGSYDLLVAAGQKHCVTADDGASLGVPVRGATKYAFVLPLGITITRNLKRDILRIHVDHAPGLKSALVEWSVDPVTTTSWKELDGNGVVRELPTPPAGTYWFRAATRRARLTSDFATPVSFVVK
jgi:hypothetical protein